MFCQCLKNVRMTFDNLVGRNKSGFTEASVILAYHGIDGHQAGNQLKMFKKCSQVICEEIF